MKNLINGMFTAFSLYSAIPVPRTEWNKKNIRFALCFMPLIGLLIGIFSLGWFALCTRFEVSAVLYAVVAVLMPILVSGGIHMDGFIDTSDAFGSHAVREKKLEILKDPHIGAFGVLFCAVQLLFSFGLWVQLFEKPRYIGIAAIAYVASRCLNAISIAWFPTAKNTGLAYLFNGSSDKKTVIISCLLVFACCIYVFTRISMLWGMFALIVFTGYFFLHRRYCLWEYGGNTGDLAGFMLQNLELLALMVAVIGGFFS